MGLLGFKGRYLNHEVYYFCHILTNIGQEIPINMSKPRTLGKPARLAGSGRKLTRVFFHTKPNHISLEDNPCMKASKDICYGLAVFHATFGCEDNKQVSELEIHSRLAPSNVK